MIRNARSFSEAVSYHETAESPSFSGYLYALMTGRGLTPKAVIQSSGIERSYFYHILSGNKKPGRNIVLRIGLCLRASLAEMNQLLRLAGLSGLYARIRRDAALIYAVQHRYTAEQTNDLLIELGEAPLYREDRHV